MPYPDRTKDIPVTFYGNVTATAAATATALAAPGAGKAWMVTQLVLTAASTGAVTFTVTGGTNKARGTVAASGGAISLPLLIGDNNSAITIAHSAIAGKDFSYQGTAHIIGSA